VQIIDKRREAVRARINRPAIYDHNHGQECSPWRGTIANVNPIGGDPSQPAH